MTAQQATTAMAGFFITLSLLFGFSASPFFYSDNWLWLTLFVGINLLQSAFTSFCPANSIFKAMGLK